MQIDSLTFESFLTYVSLYGNVRLTNTIPTVVNDLIVPGSQRTQLNAVEKRALRSIVLRRVKNAMIISALIQ
jgi:hypothetical protein